MSQVQGFGFPKLSTRKRYVLSILFRNLRFTRTNGRYRFFEDGKAKERASSFCTIEPGGVFKGEDIGLDVQELTESIENENAKSLNYWLWKFVQEVANKSGGRYASRTVALQYFLWLKKWRGRIKYIGCQRSKVSLKEFICSLHFKLL